MGLVGPETEKPGCFRVIGVATDVRKGRADRACKTGETGLSGNKERSQCEKVKSTMFSYQNESLSPDLHFVIRLFLPNAAAVDAERFGRRSSCRRYSRAVLPLYKSVLPLRPDAGCANAVAVRQSAVLNVVRNIFFMGTPSVKSIVFYGKGE